MIITNTVIDTNGLKSCFQVVLPVVHRSSRVEVQSGLCVRSAGDRIPGSFVMLPGLRPKMLVAPAGFGGSVP